MYEASIIAENIKKTAKASNIQLKDMLLDLSLNKNTLSNMYNGSMLKGDSLARIADYLDVSVDYLLGREPSSETKKDGSAKALPPDTALTPSQKQMVEFAESLTEEEIKKVLSYIRFVLSERDGK
mgnify:CR=1 FL=1